MLDQMLLVTQSVEAQLNASIDLNNAHGAEFESAQKSERQTRDLEQQAEKDAEKASKLCAHEMAEKVEWLDAQVFFLNMAELFVVQKLRTRTCEWVIGWVLLPTSASLLVCCCAYCILIYLNT